MRKPISLLLIFSFITQLFTQSLYAQYLPHLSAGVSGITALSSILPTPALLRYVSVNSANPLNYFNFLMDKGTNESQDTSHTSQVKDTSAVAEGLRGGVVGSAAEAKKLVNYFFLGLTIPEESLWVNLQPNQQDEMVSKELANTDMGKVLLEQDLQLKKDMAKYLHPQVYEGQLFWRKLEESVKCQVSGVKKEQEKQDLWHTIISNITKHDTLTHDTLTQQFDVPYRVWIVPDSATVVETEDGALVTEAKLKVMLEVEYLAQKTGDSKQITGNEIQNTENGNQKTENLSSDIGRLSSELMKQIIIPKITQAVNESPKYAQLRQIYYSLILAQWYKVRHNRESQSHKAQDTSQNTENQLTNQQTNQPSSPYEQAINKSWTKGLEAEFPWSKQKIWQEYQKSYNKGEYNTQTNVIGIGIRKFFSGGIEFSSPIVHMNGQRYELKEGALQLSSSPIKEGKKEFALNILPLNPESASSPAQSPDGLEDAKEILDSPSLEIVKTKKTGVEEENIASQVKILSNTNLQSSLALQNILQKIGFTDEEVGNILSNNKQNITWDQVGKRDKEIKLPMSIVVNKDILSDEEHLLLTAFLWDKYGVEGMKFPEGIVKKIIQSKNLSLSYVYQMIFLGINEGMINELERKLIGDYELSSEEIEFVWDVFHKLYPDESNRSYLPPQVEEAVKQVIEEKQQKIKVLDVGCGPNGKTLQTLHNMFAHNVELFGIDRKIDSYPENMELKQGDILSMPFSDESFDIVYEGYVLRYFPNEQKFKKAISEIIRVLRPGGKFVLTDKNILYDYDRGIERLQNALEGLDVNLEFIRKEGVLIIEKNSSSLTKNLSLFSSAETINTQEKASSSAHNLAFPEKTQRVFNAKLADSQGKTIKFVGKILDLLNKHPADFQTGLDEVRYYLEEKGFDWHTVRMVWRFLRQYNSAGSIELEDLNKNKRIIINQLASILLTEKFWSVYMEKIEGRQDDLAAITDMRDSLGVVMNKQEFKNTIEALSENSFLAIEGENFKADFKNLSNDEFEMIRKSTVRIKERFDTFRYERSWRNFYWAMRENELETSGLLTYFGRRYDGTYDYIYKRIKLYILNKLKNSPGVPINIIIVGAALGVQGYDVAMACVDVMDEIGIRSPIKIVITDVQQHSLDYGKRGQFRNRENLFDVDLRRKEQVEEKERRLKKFFNATKNNFVEILPSAVFDEKWGVKLFFEKVDILEEKDIERVLSYGKYDLVVAQNVHYNDNNIAPTEDFRFIEEQFYAHLVELLSKDGDTILDHVHGRGVTREEMQLFSKILKNYIVKIEKDNNVDEYELKKIRDAYFSNYNILLTLLKREAGETLKELSANFLEMIKGINDYRSFISLFGVVYPFDGRIEPVVLETLLKGAGIITLGTQLDSEEAIRLTEKNVDNLSKILTEEAKQKIKQIILSLLVKNSKDGKGDGSNSFPLTPQEKTLSSPAESNIEEYGYADLVKEGYKIKENLDYYKEADIYRMRIEVSHNDTSLASNIQISVLNQYKTLIIETFYPNFPKENKGRGRALLKYLLMRPEYAGYQILAYAESDFQKSFLNIVEFNPLVFEKAVNKTETKNQIVERIKGHLAGIDKQYPSISNSDLNDILNEQRNYISLYYNKITLYGIVPDKKLISSYLGNKKAYDAQEKVSSSTNSQKDEPQIKQSSPIKKEIVELALKRVLRDIDKAVREGSSLDDIWLELKDIDELKELISKLSRRDEDFRDLEEISSFVVNPILFKMVIGKLETKYLNAVVPKKVLSQSLVGNPQESKVEERTIKEWECGKLRAEDNNIKLQAVLKFCLAAVAYNGKARETRMVHIYGRHEDKEGKKEKDFMEDSFRDIRGKDWRIKIIISEDPMSLAPKDLAPLRWKVEDVQKYLQDQNEIPEQNFEKSDTVLLRKTVTVDNKGQVNIEYYGINKKLDEKDFSLSSRMSPQEEPLSSPAETIDTQEKVALLIKGEEPQSASPVENITLKDHIDEGNAGFLKEFEGHISLERRYVGPDTDAFFLTMYRDRTEKEKKKLEERLAEVTNDKMRQHLLELPIAGLLTVTSKGTMSYDWYDASNEINQKIRGPQEQNKEMWDVVALKKDKNNPKSLKLIVTKAVFDMLKNNNAPLKIETPRYSLEIMSVSSSLLTENTQGALNLQKRNGEMRISSPFTNEELVQLIRQAVSSIEDKAINNFLRLIKNIGVSPEEAYAGLSKNKFGFKRTMKMFLSHLSIWDENEIDKFSRVFIEIPDLIPSLLENPLDYIAHVKFTGVNLLDVWDSEKVKIFINIVTKEVFIRSCEKSPFETLAVLRNCLKDWSSFENVISKIQKEFKEILDKNLNHLLRINNENLVKLILKVGNKHFQQALINNPEEVLWSITEYVTKIDAFIEIADKIGDDFGRAFAEDLFGLSIFLKDAMANPDKYNPQSWKEERKIIKVCQNFFHSQFTSFYYKMGDKFNYDFKNLVGVFGAVGPAVADAFLMTRFKEAYFMDKIKVDYDKLVKYRDIWDEPDDRKDIFNKYERHIFNSYFRDKALYGYSKVFYFQRGNPLEIDQLDIELFIIHELKRMGVRKDDIDIQQDEDGNPVIRFKLLGEMAWEDGHKITFLHRDILDKGNLAKDEKLKNKFDFYLQKGANDLVENYKKYFPYIFSLLKKDAVVGIDPYIEGDYDFETKGMGRVDSSKLLEFFKEQGFNYSKILKEVYWKEIMKEADPYGFMLEAFYRGDQVNSWFIAARVASPVQEVEKTGKKEIVSSPIKSQPEKNEALIDEGGINFSNIELVLKDEKFVSSSVNPADYKVLLAAKALKQGFVPLSLLRIYEAVGFIEDKIVGEIQNKNLLAQVLEQLKGQVGDSMDDQLLQFPATKVPADGSNPI